MYKTNENKTEWEVVYKETGKPVTSFHFDNFILAKVIYDTLSSMYPQVRLFSITTTRDVQEQNFEGEFDNWVYLDGKI